MGLSPLATWVDELKGLGPDENARQRCIIAKEFEDAGEYEQALGVMKGLWDGIGTRPRLDGISRQIAAQVLLVVGCLTGWIGTTEQLEGALEVAENLLNEALSIFDELGLSEKSTEALNGLAICLWRRGAYDLAIEKIKEGLLRLDEKNVDIRLSLTLNWAMVEQTRGQDEEAMRLQTEAAPLADQASSHALKARFFHGLAIVKSKLGDFQGALVENTGASYHYLEAGNKRAYAGIENNLGYQYFKLGKFEEAHEHLERARNILSDLNDQGILPIILETRACVFIEQRRLTEAEESASEAVRILERGEDVFIINALVTLGRALARMRRKDEAWQTFIRAHQLATGISSQKADEVGVAMFGELSGMIYVGAGVTFEAAVHTFEASLIKESLYLSNRKTPPAALRLSLPLTTLLTMLQGRHHQLLPERTEIRSRKKSYIVGKKGGTTKAKVSRLKVKQN
jgi:tetratricopeptide (TPR) repeat protein